MMIVKRFLIFFVMVTFLTISLEAQDNPPSDRVRALAWSPDGSKIAYANISGLTNIIDFSTGQPLHTLQTDYTGATVALAWSPDGNQLATGGVDKVVRIWNTSTGCSKSA